MNFDQPNAMQRSWREHVRLRGSVVSFPRRPELIEIHHPLGRTAKHDKIHIGHWFVVPVLKSEHELFKATGLPELIDIWTRNHGGRWSEIEKLSLHEFEKFLFREMCADITVLPFEHDVEETIQAWSR